MLCGVSTRDQTALTTDTQRTKVAKVERRKLRHNPLLWGVFGAIAALLPPYRFRDFLDLLLPAAALIFLIAYFLRSRFAWHILAANVLIVTPLYMFFSPSWHLQLILHPQITWFPIVATCVFALLVFWSRNRYFSYLEQQRESGN